MEFTETVLGTVPGTTFATDRLDSVLRMFNGSGLGGPNRTLQRTNVPRPTTTRQTLQTVVI